MKLVINHLTHYRYNDMVKLSTQYLRLTPQNSARQQIESWYLSLPQASSVNTVDAYGNIMQVLTLDRPHQEITIHAQGVVDISEAEDLPPCDEEILSPLVFLRHTHMTEANGTLREFALQFYKPQNAAESLVNLMYAIREKMPYTPGSTDVQDSAIISFNKGTGVCQDHAHVFLACCRSLKIPARYVSGYVFSQDTQHVAMHAWAEAWINGHWQSFDITNSTQQLHQHLRLAVGLDYLDACPVRGTRLGGGCEELFSEAEVQQFEQQQQ